MEHDAFERFLIADFIQMKKIQTGYTDTGREIELITPRPA